MNYETILDVINIKKTYKNSKTPALKGISLSLKKGEVYGLLGPNGAGKTTAISIMSTLIKPDSGSVEICGKNLQQATVAIKAKIGLVPQNIALYPTLTVRENLKYFGKLNGLRGKKLSSRIDEMFDLMEFEKHADKQIQNFSGGMKRRANIAAGILHTPDLLFLDEPTLGIDLQSRNMIFKKLKELSQNGITILYTSHYMEEIQQICNRVSIIDYGKIICEGIPDDIINEHVDCFNLEDVFLKLTGHTLRN